MPTEKTSTRMVAMPHELSPSSSGHRFSTLNASEFGRVESMIKISDNIPAFHFDRSRKRIAQRLDEIGFDVGRDYVALTGNIMYVTALVAEVALRSKGVPIRLLVHDAHQNKYVSKLLPTD